MRFSTQMLLLQLACVAAVVVVCTGVFVWIGVQQLRAEAEGLRPVDRSNCRRRC